MTPEELEDLKDMQASVRQIVDLVREAEADKTLTYKDSVRIASMTERMVGMLQDLVDGAEDSDDDEDRLGVLRSMLATAEAADELAGSVLIRQSGVADRL